MDPRKLFFDERLKGFCVFCGGPHETDDHVPSKVLLDEPFPDNLPLVAACKKCNNQFSIDEPYLACLIDCVIAGSVDPNKVGREKVRRILSKRPHIGVQIDAGRRKNLFGDLEWETDSARVRNVVLKLARGHVYYELGEPQFGEPEQLWFVPLEVMSAEQREAFEANTGSGLAAWPEIGSRAFHRVSVVGPEAFIDDGWQVVQPGRYRYWVSWSGEARVRMVLSEYLACEAAW